MAHQDLRVQPCFAAACSEDVARALQVCARDMFVPREHAAEALIDTPVRLSAQVQIPALRRNFGPHLQTTICSGRRSTNHSRTLPYLCAGLQHLGAAHACQLPGGAAPEAWPPVRPLPPGQLETCSSGVEATPGAELFRKPLAATAMPVNRFLDVGSGCGVLTAAAALLVGRSGASVGIDIKTCAIEMVIPLCCAAVMQCGLCSGVLPSLK